MPFSSTRRALLPRFLSGGTALRAKRRLPGGERRAEDVHACALLSATQSAGAVLKRALDARELRFQFGAKRHRRPVRAIHKEPQPVGRAEVSECVKIVVDAGRRRTRARDDRDRLASAAPGLVRRRRQQFGPHLEPVVGRHRDQPVAPQTITCTARTVQ